MSRVLIDGVLDVEGKAACDRCLEVFDLRYEAPVDVQIVRSSMPAPDDDGSETIVMHQAHGQLDMSDAIRESLMLALPLKTVCSEDCQGICAICGANRNQNSCDCEQEITDPRWDGLPT